MGFISLTHLQTALNKIKTIFDTKAELTDIPDKLPADGGNADTVNGHTVNANVPADAVFTDTTYKTASQTEDGLMSAADKEKLDGIAANANKYSLPLATASVRGGVKIGYEENGKNYPVELSNEKMFVNVPWTDTTYSAATSSNAGLMSSSDKKKLDGIAAGANKYTLPTASSSTLGGVKTSSTVTSSSGYTACPIISGVPYYKDTNKTYPTATSSANGLMSSNDKKKLDGIYSEATPVTIRTGNVPKDGATNNTVSLAYISGRKNALVMVYLHGRISNLSYSVFDSLLLTGISNSMNASSSKINTGSDTDTGCEVAISTKGVITLKPTPGATASQRYIVIYYN